MADRIHYRKLPGHRRGFFRSSSAWLGPDYLLAVNSIRFREEYKRYVTDLDGHLLKIDLSVHDWFDARRVLA